MLLPLVILRVDAASFDEAVRPFLERHCHSCHDARKAKAGFRIDQLGRDFLQGRTADEWKEVMDHINLGEMPPKDEPRPDPRESFAVVKWIAGELRQAEKAARLLGGRTPMRRLNRDEYSNTVRDLLHLDAASLAPVLEDLPGDGKAEGFDRLGVALFFDQTQMEKTIEAAERLAAMAVVDPADKPEQFKTRFEPELLLKRGGMGVRPAEVTTRNRYVRNGRHEVATGVLTHHVENLGVRFVQGFGNSNARGRMGNAQLDELVTEDGYYRVRARVGANQGTRGEPMILHLTFCSRTPQEVNVDLPVTAPMENPEVIETVMFLRHGSPDQRRRLVIAFNNIENYIISSDEAQSLNRSGRDLISAIREAKKQGDQDEVERRQLELEKHYQRAEAWRGPARRVNPKYADQVPPQIFIDWLDVEGPLHGEWPPKSHRELLFDGDGRNDLVYAKEIIERFLPRAYRRPVQAEEVDRIASLIGAELEAGTGFYPALRTGLSRILSSPAFVFLSEPAAEGPRPLNDHELASRLSYFLWSTMPDERLFELAAAKRLRQPDILPAEVKRLLADKRSREFVENFAGQWLSVREFGSVSPAENLYNEYDQELEEASKQEAYAFFAEILRNDLPITHFLDSDFVTINERLARHYGIDGVEGRHFRRVALAPQHHRGGIFGLAGLMTLLADGTRTLPVRRAAWIRENLFNDPLPPPPPNAGEVQPNTSGEKLTVRERLERHRNEPTCASCHTPLDPYGLALENYDAIGKWRTHQNGENFRSRRAPELDVSGQLPSGRKFSSLEEFKAALLAEKDAFARAFSERLLTYALTRPVGYIDHQTVDALMKTLQQNDYRIQPLIEAVVLSEAFQTK